MFPTDISKLCLGAASFGTGISPQNSFSILDAYVDNGGSFIDTAAVYGMGKSEKTIGEWLKERGNRSTITISTKGGHPSLPDWHKRITQSDIQADIECSLKNLQTDCIDIYFLHRDDTDQPVEAIMPILDRLVRDGKTRYIGASNWTVARINEANAFAKANGLTEFAASQIFWCGAKINIENVYDQTLVAMDDTEHAGYAQNGMPVMAYTSQARGLFSRIRDNGYDALTDTLKRTYLNPTTKERAEKIIEVSTRSGISPSAVSLAYLLFDKDVNAYPIIGTSRPERISEVMKVFSLSKDDIDLLLS